jgi:hypothetical protein
MNPIKLPVKYTIPLLTIFAMSIFSCTNTSQKEVPGNTVIANTTAHCYSYTGNTDSVTMSIHINDNTVTGELEYHLYEKDSNTGTIQGMIKGDTLYAEYRFISEGVSSVREVAFLKKEDKWVEGFGSMEENNGSMVFKDRSSLQFNSTIVLTELPCKE